MASSPPKEILALLKSISNKRARVVIDHILKKGFITTEDLEKRYGYNHPPRAARDVREAGIPLETFRVTSSDGRSIAAYKFGDLSLIQRDRLAGRTILTKAFKQALYEKTKGKCGICFGRFESLYLQIDHRIPYEVAGETGGERDLAHYMLLCGSCNRAKSWSCEHCQNIVSGKNPDICSKCYWANPEDYLHIALRETRRLDLVWEGDEVKTYQRLKRKAQEARAEMPSYVKRVISQHVEQDQELPRKINLAGM